MGWWTDLKNGVSSFISGGTGSTGTALDLIIPTTNGNSPTSFLTDSAGLTNTSEKNAAYDNANDTISDIIAQQGQTYENVRQNIQQGADNISDLLGGTEAIQNYLDAVNGFSGDNYKTDTSALSNWNNPLENYSFDKTVQDFMDPAADYTINQSVKAAQNALAGQGGMSGGAAAQQLQAVASEKASELYDKAYDRFQKAEETDYARAKDLSDSEYNQIKDILSAEQQNNANALTADTTNINNLGNVSNSVLSNAQNAQEEILQSILSEQESKSNLMQALAQMQIDKANSNKGVIGNILGGILG